MAKDNKTNDEGKDFFGDEDDDFGLPELKYESLQDDANDKSKEDLDDLEDIAFEKEAALTDDFEGDIDFYEEESFEDAEPFDSGEDSDSTSDSDVLDDDEFAKFEQELEEQGDFGRFEHNDNKDYSAKGKFAQIVIVGSLAFLALGAAFWIVWKNYFGDKKQQLTENMTREISAEKDSALEKTDSIANLNSVVEESALEKEKAVAAVSDQGIVNELTAATGNYYIVIGSFLDDDLARDYTTQLVAQGESLTLIPPFGEAITHRVAINGYADFATARDNISSYKGQFGEDIWILKY